MGLTDRQWKNLINDIRQERCILLLGPMLPSIQLPGSTAPMLITDHLAGVLKKELEQEEIDFDGKLSRDAEYLAQRYLLIPFTKEIHLKDEVANIYAQFAGQIPDVYNKMARIPFHLVINTTPDTYYWQAIRTSSPNATFSYYSYEEPIGLPETKISKESPLAYNLMGAYSDPKSMVLTEAQQVAFIKRTLQGNPPIPPRILEKLKPGPDSAELSYLFLGFNLDRWQFRVLLDGLDINPGSQPLAPRHPKLQLKRRTIEYYTSRFNFHFVHEEIDDFLDELIQRYSSIPEDIIGAVAPNEAKKVVVSFHPNALGYCEALSQAHSQLVRNKEVEIWHRGMILSGDVQAQTESNIRSADLILVLLDREYLANEDIFKYEIPAIIEQHQSGKSIVAPVLADYCDWEESPFQHLQILPNNREPLSSNKWGNQAFAINEVLKSIKRIIRH